MSAFRANDLRVNKDRIGAPRAFISPVYFIGYKCHVGIVLIHSVSQRAPIWSHSRIAWVEMILRSLHQEQANGYPGKVSRQEFVGHVSFLLDGKRLLAPVGLRLDDLCRLSRRLSRRSLVSRMVGVIPAVFDILISVFDAIADRAQSAE